MNHWDEVLPGKVHRVIYEEMVNDTENEVRRLLNFVSCRLRAIVWSFIAMSAPFERSSEQVRQFISKGIGQWEPFAIWLDPCVALWATTHRGQNLRLRLVLKEESKK